METLPGQELDSSAFLAIGRVVKTQGRRGEVLTEMLTDFPARFDGLRRVHLAMGRGAEAGAAQAAEIEDAWPHKGRMVLKFAGVNSISEAERLVGMHVLVPRQDRVELPRDHYYLWELEGCRVVTERDGAQSELGTVTEVERTGGVHLLHVAPRDGRREMLIPLAQAICTRIDTEARIVVIDPPEGLLDLNG
jgi:16S rRNA processing protein RimM